ncbi:hypothetical protein QA601_18210 [Chitinispirillales bacterium ANBcel5]|uniref:hypothetical protein n=1 Tax=Cellulosispirillum alkaliphilum TaxID=3039283 RepID=UPI002A52F78F|nr:hypothetical protein [Chitinispirillales bacterium ANBcel5]
MNYLKVVIVWLVVLLFSGCTDSPVSPDSTPPDPSFTDGGTTPDGTADNPSGTTKTISEEDREFAREKLQVALSLLEEELSKDLISADMYKANTAFKAAIEADPNNTEAQFGAAITELIMINQNETFNEFADELTANETGLFKTQTIPLKLNPAKMRNVDRIVPTIASAPASELPKISELQNAVKDELLPSIIYALDRLSIIQNDETFKFEITPQMLGETYGDSYILDLGEVYVIDAGLRIMRAIMLTLISYNIDIDNNGSYDWISSGSDSILAVNIKRLHQSNSFLTLHDHGEGSMNAAILNLRQSVEKLENSLDFISARTSDQMFHIIKAEYIDDLDAELEYHGGLNAFSVKDMLNEVTKFLSGPYDIEIDYDLSLRVNVSAIFDNPIRDLKTKFPYMQWRDPSDWRQIDLHGYEYFEPLDFTDRSGNVLSDYDLSYEGPHFPDYTFGGLFPRMSTRNQWIEFFDELYIDPWDDDYYYDDDYYWYTLSNFMYGKVLK